MTIDDLKKTAQMANLILDDGEYDKIFPVFSEIFKYLDIIQLAEDDKIAFPEEFSLTIPGFGYEINDSSLLRADNPIADAEIKDKLDEKLLGNSGERDGRFIVIPNVL